MRPRPGFNGGWFFIGLSHFRILWFSLSVRPNQLRHRFIHARGVSECQGNRPVLELCSDSRNFVAESAGRKFGRVFELLAVSICRPDFGLLRFVFVLVTVALFVNAG